MFAVSSVRKSLAPECTVSSSESACENVHELPLAGSSQW